MHFSYTNCGELFETQRVFGKVQTIDLRADDRAATLYQRVVVQIKEEC